MVEHRKMSLFNAPDDAIIMHACNSQGVWGSGIARAFHDKYEMSFQWYRAFCLEKNQRRGTACGMSCLMKFVAEPHWVGWIVTSHDYGPKKDSPEQIKINTTLALREFCAEVYRFFHHEEYPTIDVYSNKFNSGLFNVPWEDSELILKTVLRDFKRINWIVCSEVESK